MGLVFEWDEDKAESNLKKHEVSFEEAATVFGDPLSVTIVDPVHSKPEEHRFITMGLSCRQNLLIVVHCDRGRSIRIISARKTTKQEKKDYEEQ
ncbi:MAG: BrnT family toxin [Spirochaetales bacterium]|nr:BrnT family toxin [Spirochaetales bacterium]